MELREAQDIVEDLVFTEDGEYLGDGHREAIKTVWQHSVEHTPDHKD